MARKKVNAAQKAAVAAIAALSAKVRKAVEVDALLRAALKTPPSGAEALWDTLIDAVTSGLPPTGARMDD